MQVNRCDALVCLSTWIMDVDLQIGILTTTCACLFLYYQLLPHEVIVGHSGLICAKQGDEEELPITFSIDLEQHKKMWTNKVNVSMTFLLLERTPGG